LQPTDLTDRAAVKELVKGAEAVVHCAFGGAADHEQLIPALLEESAAAGVRCFIHISTTEAYESQQGTLDEDSPLQSSGNEYGAVKARIDAQVRSYADKFPNLVILRPGIIYGPLSDSWTVTPIKRLLQGWSPDLNTMQGIGGFVHIADVCRTILLLLSRPVSGLRVYNLVGPEVVTWANYFEMLRKALQIAASAQKTGVSEKAKLGVVRLLLKKLPTGFRRKITNLVTSVPVGGRMVAGWRRLHLVEPMSADKVLYARTVRYSNARLIQDGLAPRVNLTEGIQQSATWARQVGLV
jgi:nucleoside-diphosphate-sugar epimerase